MATGDLSGVQSLSAIVGQQNLLPSSVKQRHLVGNPSQPGDMYYGQDGNNFARVGIGTEGQGLTVLGGIPTWNSQIGIVSKTKGIDYTKVATTELFTVPTGVNFFVLDQMYVISTNLQGISAASLNHLPNWQLGNNSSSYNNIFGNNYEFLDASNQQDNWNPLEVGNSAITPSGQSIFLNVTFAASASIYQADIYLSGFYI